MRLRVSLVSFLLLHSLQCATLLSANRADVVQLELLPTAHVTEALVRVADIAKLSGGTPTARAKIAQQDIILLDDSGASAKVSQARIQIRLLLAGLAPDSFEIEGAATVQVGRGDPKINTAWIRKELLKTIASQFNAEPEQLELTLTREINLPTWPLSAQASPRIVFYLPERLQLGNLRTTAAIYDGATLLGKVEVYAQLGRYQMVPRTTQAVPRNTPLTAANVRTERRLLTTGTGDEFAQTFMGQVARRTLPARTLIYSRDIVTQQAAEITIRSQTPVQLVARVGGVTVTMNNAVTLQAGRIGDMIQVRNLSSKTTHIGKITSGSQVEVITR